MLLLPLSCIKPVAITMLAVCDISIISTYVTSAEAKLDQSQTDKVYLDCWNNLQCKQRINQKFNATKLPNCLDTDDVGICYDTVRHLVHQ
jgi:hypothetical protein